MKDKEKDNEKMKAAKAAMTDEEKNKKEASEEKMKAGADEAAKEKMEAADRSDEPLKDDEKAGSHDKENGTEKQKGKAEEEPKKDARDKKIEELSDKVMRQMAEFDNFRKRTEKEKDQMFDTGARSVIEKILPVVDNFERGLEAVKDKTDDPFVDGMDKVYKQLITELDTIGVKPIEAVGQNFDPAFHNAVMQEESEELESGKVARELQKGYIYRNTVVRHSMVSVVK